MSDFCQYGERKARKDHVCCNCKQVISKGTKYLYISGVWENKPDSFKCCKTCFSVLQNIRLFDNDFLEENMPEVDGLVEFFNGYVDQYWNGEVAVVDIVNCFSIPHEHARILLGVVND